VYQAWVTDTSTGEQRRLTDEPVGVTAAEITPDGQGVAWFHDTTGDESGRYVVTPVDGGEPRPLLSGAPVGWPEGLALGRERVAAGISSAEGFGIWVAEGNPSAGNLEARLLHRHAESVRVGGGSTLLEGSNQGGLSADGQLLALEHSEHGDLMHPALRVVDVTTGATVAELRDEGRELLTVAWSPVPGDARLAIGHERDGERRPGIWDVRTGDVIELRPELDGVVDVADWWPDASALLLVQLVEARDYLYRLDLASGALEHLPTPAGTIWGARVLPDGSVWYRHESSEDPGSIRAVGRESPVLPPPDPPAPPGRPVEAWWFENPAGDRVHGLFIAPDGPGPHPVLMLVHGGPNWLDLDDWSPSTQAFVDAGFLVGMVNYRGSVGYGRAWRDHLIGNIGWPEVEDVLAGLDDLAARDLADPDRAVIGGWSWGGYITLLMLGMHPDRFMAGVAGVPVGDYAASYEDLSPSLQAYDRALIGGRPDEVPDLMRERSPITYVDAVTAPVLFLYGVNDTRCPPRQVEIYVDRLAARSHPHEVYVYGTGHGSYDLDERVRQTATVLDFLARHVPGIRELPGVADALA
jgi:dipeptidyl aminopeptidase/acylaminoacyl peptidase